MTKQHILELTYPAPQKSMAWQNLQGASVGLAISEAIKQSNAPLLIIAPDNLLVSHLYDELHFFSPGTTVLNFPDWETLPYDHFSPHQDIISDRLRVLNRLPSLSSGAVITTIATLMHHLPPKDYIDKHSFVLKTGDKLNLDTLKKRLTNSGYHHVKEVREHGEYAIRGSLIDIFPMGSRKPYRIDLFDDEVESIRYFQVDTQRSAEKIEHINLLPAKEFPLDEAAIELFRQHFREAFPGNPLKSMIYQDISEGICTPGIEYYLPLFFNQTSSLFDYLPENTMIVVVDDVNARANEFLDEINVRYEQCRFDQSRPLLAKETLFYNQEAIAARLKHFATIYINPPTDMKGLTVDTAASPTIEINYKATNPFEPLKSFIQASTLRLLFCAETGGRREVMLQAFSNIGIQPKLFQSWDEFVNSDAQLGIIVSPIENGFILNDLNIAVLTESALYGKKVQQRRLRKKTAIDTDAIVRDLTELKINDAVVHLDHGIGRYLGLTTLKIGKQLGEFLSLEYQGGDKLYVPVSSLQLISRYTGSDPDHIPISKLGTEQWQRAKKRAAEKAHDVAAELLNLYANREASEGEAYEIPQAEYEKFIAAFPFEETPDQLQSIDAVFKDLCQTKPMDRVVCGDVGFGKTEVALRAAFVAVHNSKQVAILVPTTLLAQQHFQYFQDRFADWPIKIELLSRFRSSKEQKITLEKMQAGTVDIIIGTHKLLQSDILFKSLGLVVIDEEHRFGVKQKEKLKALRKSVNILTLTATPIPRTLNMALAGIRDLSIIATPPAKRLSVKTFVHEYADSIIQEAIQREIFRGGQVYFLHNDISTINKKAESISHLVKEAKTLVAHGQMNEKDLERIMADFYHRHANVLVCSTIIESGIDIPTANTIIINRADKFGLAQIHQLRGRVGRSHHQAYAYLLTPPPKLMTKDALKRLDAISSLDDLGVGFTLATHDLEIRGAGELLGEEQSGNMHEVGFTMYMDLLSRAVEAIKKGEELTIEPERGCEIDLHLTALIPENYLYDVELRLQFYKRIASAKDDDALDDIQVEMIDRFGLIPPPLKVLFSIHSLKLIADRLGIIKMDLNSHGGRIEFSHKPAIKPETIIHLIQTKQTKYQLDGPTKLKVKIASHNAEDRIAIAKQILDELSA